MEERRSNGFRVKPSFGQVLGYIQEGEPLTLDLPNRKASIYTSSHFYLDDYPNAPEPVSETPLPHTSLNPAAAFETADEGYSGTPYLAAGRLCGTKQISNQIYLSKYIKGYLSNHPQYISIAIAKHSLQGTSGQLFSLRCTGLWPAGSFEDCRSCDTHL